MPAGIGGYARPFACAAVVGFVAILMVSAHRHTAASRHCAQVSKGLVSSVAWAVPPREISSSMTQVAQPVLHRVFWVGLISVASGVAVVQLAGRIRIGRIGSRCGH